MLVKTPALSVVIIFILAIGIGSGTALYSLIDACLLRSNTYPVVGRWDVVRAYLPPSKSFVNYLSAPEIREIQQLHELFEDVGAVHGDGFNLTHTEDPERVAGTYVSANMIPMTGVAPILGRTFREDEDRPGGPPVVVMSFELWKRKFGADRNVVGQTIRLNDVEHTIIGVMPAHYGLWGGQVWVPLRLDVADQNRANRRNWAVCVLRKGVTEAQANARLQVLSKQLEQKYGPSMPEYRDWNLSIWNINELVLGGIKPALLVLAGALAFLLWIACTNVAILLLARATSRMREVAIRMALGANRTRIRRHLRTDAMLLSLVGA